MLAVLLPLMARTAVLAHGLRGDGRARGSWRATWAFTLLLTFATAFTPVVWPLAVVLGVGVLALRRRDLAAYGLRFVATVGTPLLVLAPWSLTLLSSPSDLLREAGRDLGEGTASAVDLLSLSPGGPNGTGSVLFFGIVLAALAALLRGERRTAIHASWAAVLAGLLFAGLVNGTTWAGPATLVYGAALITAALLGADGARIRVAALSFGWRQPVAALIAVAAAAAPVLAALGWMAAWRLRAAGASRPGAGAGLRRGGERYARPAAHPRARRHLGRLGLVHPGPRLGRPARRRRADRGGRRAAAPSTRSSPTWSPYPAPTRATSSAVSRCGTSSYATALRAR